jgi:hypothetical protein
VQSSYIVEMGQPGAEGCLSVCSAIKGVLPLIFVP